MGKKDRVYCDMAQGRATFALGNKNGNAMFEIIVTLGLAAFAIWLLLDSAVEYIRDGQEDTLATEP